jgi:hypothetical protein
VLEQLRLLLPDIIPLRDRELVRMLRAVRHLHRYTATDTRRGRPSPWRRQDLWLVATRLTEILERETASPLSLSSFIDHYVRLLGFPADVVRALEGGEINLFEAEQLARLTPERLGTGSVEAKRRRADLLATHVQARLSGNSLRQRINELLRVLTTEAGDSAKDNAESTKNSAEIDLEDFDPYDPTHLFWDQIKQLGFALRDIRTEDVSDEEIDELLRVSEPVLTVLARIQRRKERKTLKLGV